MYFNSSKMIRGLHLIISKVWSQGNYTCFVFKQYVISLKKKHQTAGVTLYNVFSWIIICQAYTALVHCSLLLLFIVFCCWFIQISVGCRSSRDDCTTDQAVQLEYNTEPSSDKWHLVQKPCMQPASSSNMDCGLHNHHQGSIYTANSHGAWTRVTIPLLHKVYSR